MSIGGKFVKNVNNTIFQKKNKQEIWTMKIFLECDATEAFEIGYEWFGRQLEPSMPLINAPRTKELRIVNTLAL